MVKPEVETEAEPQGRRSVRRRLLLSLRQVRIILTAAGLAVAVALGIRGSLLLHDPRMRRFDEALVLYGVALLGLLVFAAGGLPRPQPGWRSRLVGFCSRHRLELALLTAIIAFAVFMRAYMVGVFPPKDALAFEEGISGGVAYNILQGARPLFYPARYVVAASMAVFGENTFGLRFASIAMGILTVPALYLLLRRLVSVPAALFGTALLAGAYWPSLHNRVTADATLFTVLLALTMVVGVQRRSAVLFALAGVLAGLLSYEYEAFKPVPIYAVGFLAVAALWYLSRALLRDRWWGLKQTAAVMAKAGWRPAVAFVVAAGIVAAPLMMGEHLGQDLYLSSLHRQEGDRENRGTPGLFAPNWETQTKWAAQIFVSFESRDYPLRLPLVPAGDPLIDPLSGLLLVGGLVWALLTFWRPWRLFFAGWFLATLMGAALLLSNWEAWKFVGLLPVGLVMTAFLVDDARSALPRLVASQRFTALAFPVALAGIAAYSWFWNADLFFGDIVHRRDMDLSYASKQSQWYAFCDYLRGRGADNFTYAFNGADPSLGFGRPRDTLTQQGSAWGDFIWVCHDLQGTALPSYAEAWPLRDVKDGRLTLAFIVAAEGLPELLRGVQTGYPGLEPDRLEEGPAKQYYLVGYDLTPDVIRGRRGLYAEYTPEGGSVPAMRRVDKAHDLSWSDVEVPVQPFSVLWRGLAYLRAGGAWSMQAVTEDTAYISIDGGPAFAAGTSPPAAGPLDAGWHTLEIRLQKERPGGSFALEWVSQSGERRPLEEQDLFALESFEGWTHVREYRTAAGGFGVRRVDGWVDVGVEALLPEEAGVTSAGKEAAPAGEFFYSTWTLRQEYAPVLLLRYSGGDAVIMIDGKEIKRCSVRPEQYADCVAQQTLSAGEHKVVIERRGGGLGWSGGRLLVSGPEYEPVPDGAIEISPF